VYPWAKLAAKPVKRASSSDLTLSFEDAGGSTRSNGKRNAAAYCRAIRYLDQRGGGTLLIPAKVFPLEGNVSCKATNVTVEGYGATFAGDYCRLIIGEGSSSYNIYGLTLVETSGDLKTVLLDCAASNCHFKDVHLEKNPPARGYIGFCEEQTSGCLFENISFSGSNGIYLGGHDHEISGGWADSYGHDDCWVLKALQHPCYNIKISGFRARGFGALVSIGSEIGSFASDDPSRKLFVKNVLVENCAATECCYFAYIKPGAVPANDYRDGVVEDVTIRNCTIEDKSGTMFRNGVFVTPGRGAIVRRLTVQDLTVTARGENPAHQTIAAVYLVPLNSTDGSGVSSSIDDVVVSGLRCKDPYGGAATGPSTPGTPLHSLVAMEKQSEGIGRLGKVQITDSSIDGCARMAVEVGADLEGPIDFSTCTFGNYAAAIYGSADKGSVMALSPVTLTDITAKPSPNAPPDTRGVMPDAQPDKTVAYVGDQDATSVPAIAAGTDVASPVFTSVRKTWISKVEISARQAIPASNTDFVRFTLRNASNGEILGSATTTNGFLAQADTAYSVNGDIQFSGAAASIPKDSELLLEITQAGAGAAVPDLAVTVHSVPFGLS
jgi:hypothetical protein